MRRPLAPSPKSCKTSVLGRGLARLRVGSTPQPRCWTESLGWAEPPEEDRLPFRVWAQQRRPGQNAAGVPLSTLGPEAWPRQEQRAQA